MKLPTTLTLPFVYLLTRPRKKLNLCVLQLTGALSSLFWLPARLHPEIAPQEFRNFLKEQTNPENLLKRHGQLARRKSTLSKQYTPSTDDGVPVAGEEAASSLAKQTEQLTLSDLQRLEELTSELGSGPSQESDARLRSLLHRSMSLGTLAGLFSATCYIQADLLT
jgi:hypothetical protein